MGRPLASSGMVWLEPKYGSGDGTDGAGEGRQVEWAGPDCAGTCQSQDFRLLGQRKFFNQGVFKGGFFLLFFF